MSNLTLPDGYELTYHFSATPSSLPVGENDGDLPGKMQELRSGTEASLESNGKQQKVDLVVIKNAGRACYIDRFDDFCKTVVGFLER